MQTNLLKGFVLLCVLLVGQSGFGQERHQLKLATPLEATGAILDAFKSHDIVALAEGNHGNEQGHAFRLKLIRDPRFARTVNDIVVECGNSLYQNVIDRFMRGEDVPYGELRRVWQDTSVSNSIWDTPIYEEFFRTVREVNASLPASRKLRVLLGDPPIDWNQIKSRDEWLAVLKQRDSFPAELIQREVLAKHRRAIVIYGEGHFMRKNVFWDISNRTLAEQRFAKPFDNLIIRLERTSPRVFSIYTNTKSDLAAAQPNVAGWQAPKLAIVAGTLLEHFQPWEAYIMVDPEKGIEEQAHADPERSPTMAEQFDAILYLGPASSITMSKLPSVLCSDPGYLQMRSQRAVLTALPAQAADAAMWTKQACTDL